MARFYGNIGFGDANEVRPGVWSPTGGIVDKPYSGDLVSNSWRIQSSGDVNDDVNISSDVSIIADQYAVQNINNMKYAVVNGIKWKVKTVDVKLPRLILVLGGVYNG